MKGYTKPPRAIHGRFSIFGRVVYLCGGRTSKSTPRSTELEAEINCDNCIAKLARIDREIEARARDRADEPPQRELFRPALRLVGRT